LHSGLVNCGKELAILEPSGMTVQCPDIEVGAIIDVIEETKLCAECLTEEDEENVGSAWDRWLSWRRGGRS
jgi:hypothetical protein